MNGNRFFLKRVLPLVGLAFLTGLMLSPSVASASPGWFGDSRKPVAGGRDASAENLGWRLGAQAYSFRLFTFFEAVDKASSLGLKYVEAYPGQRVSKNSETKMGPDLSATERWRVKSKLRSSGVRLVNFGVAGANDELGWVRLFLFAKDMGIETIVSEPDPSQMDLIEGLCKEFKIDLAIHNHPKPSRYWNPKTVLETVKGRSKRIGACADTGHWIRSGLDPLECLRLLEGRIVSLHLKDLNERSRDAHDVPWGTGVCDVYGLLTELERQDFEGVFSVEYEHNWENSLPEIRRGVNYFHFMAMLLGDPDYGRLVEAEGYPQLFEDELYRASPGLLKDMETKLIRTLEPGAAGDEGKKFVCRMLRRMGTERSIPALGRLLPDPNLSHMARFALTAIPSAKVDREFRRALKIRGDLKIGIISSIASRGDRKAVGALEDLLEHYNPDVQLAAIEALGRIGGERAAKALSSILEGLTARKSILAGIGGTSHSTALTPTETRIVDAYLRCADSVAAEGKTEAAAVIYEELSGERHYPAVRVAAYRGLALLDPGNAPSIILDLLRDEDQDLQLAAGNLLLEMPEGVEVKEIAQALPSLSANARVVLLSVLGVRGDKSVLPEIAQVAESGDEAVRFTALEALGLLGDASVVPTLAASLKVGGEITKRAAASLNQLKGEGVDAAILKYLDGAETEVRVHLIDCLVARRCRIAVPALLHHVNASSEAVRKQSLRAIGVLAEEKDLPELVKLLGLARDDAERKSVEKALRAVGGRAQDEEKRTRVLMGALAKAAPPERASLLAVLGAFGGKRALDANVEALTSGNKTVRDAAYRALAGWPDAAAGRLLLDLAETAPEEIQRLRALQGAIRMATLPPPGYRSTSEKEKEFETLMKKARRTEEKRRILQAVTRFPSPWALRFVERHLNDEALKDEAKAAREKISKDLGKQ